MVELQMYTRVLSDILGLRLTSFRALESLEIIHSPLAKNSVSLSTSPSKGASIFQALQTACPTLRSVSIFGQNLETITIRRSLAYSLDI